MLSSELELIISFQDKSFLIGFVVTTDRMDSMPDSNVKRFETFATYWYTVAMVYNSLMITQQSSTFQKGDSIFACACVLDYDIYTEDVKIMGISAIIMRMLGVWQRWVRVTMSYLAYNLKSLRSLDFRTLCFMLYQKPNATLYIYICSGNGVINNHFPTELVCICS